MLFRSNKKSSKNNIDQYLEEFYKLFNGNENPYTSKKLNKLIDKTMQASTDIKNRSLPECGGTPAACETGHRDVS